MHACVLQDGNTALHIAVGTGKVVLAKKLFMSGAHTDVKNKVLIIMIWCN